MSSDNSNNSTSSQPMKAPPTQSAQAGGRKPIELISQAIRGERSTKAANGDGLEKAEAVGGDYTPTSKPERQTDPTPIRPALETDEDDDDRGEPGERQKKQRRSLQEIAEETGVPVKRIYDALVDVGIEGEEPVSVGTLKDHYRETRTFQQERDTFETDRDTFHTEILAGRSQVQGVVDKIVSAVGPEIFQRVLGEVRQEQLAKLQTAKAQLLEWYPHWSDHTAMARDRELIEETLGSYGWSKHDVGSIQDARIVKFILDAAKLRKRYDRLKAGTVEPKPTTQAPSRKQHRPSSFDEAKALAARGDKLGGVAKLLG